ncbi:MAG TPA: hypothetical protein VG412_03260 [Acidimicrobiales bacterium]|nr:hypothetical protein [Acidimicrobiales bacterium]
MLVGSIEQGTPTAQDLTLLIDQQGVNIFSRQPPDKRSVPWSAITNLWFGETGVDSSGRITTPLDITSANRTVRFYLYGDPSQESQVSQLRAWLPMWQATASGEGPVAPPPSPAPQPFTPGPPPTPPTPPSPLAPPTSPPAAPPAAPAPPPFPPPAPPGWTPTPFGSPPPPPAFYGIVQPHSPPFAYPPPPFLFAPAPLPNRRRRLRRPAILLLALGLLVAGGGLAAILLAVTNHHPPTSRATRTVSPDQGLANQLMLTAKDLPVGWQAGDNSGGASQHDLAVQDQINKTFNRCMSITADQGNVALGGQAQDQTAQAASPPFLAPSATPGSGDTTVPGPQPGQASTLELQTDANIVKTHADEQRDFTLFTSPKFPQCNAAAVAAALQLGLNDATGGNATAGPATAKVVDLVAPRGEQVIGVTMQFTISDGTTEIPTEVDQLVVGTSRTEAQLQALAIGATFPTDVLSAAISTFEGRVAAQGTGTTA